MKRQRGKKDPVDWISTGSTLLNLSCSDTVTGAFRPGTLVNIVGDSSAGKSMLCLTLLAEIANDPKFDDYELIYDDVERRLFFNIEKMFGSKLAGRIKGPKNGVVGEDASLTLEEFYYGVDSLFKNEKPFIYILDSQDALDSEANEKKFQENKEAFIKEKDAKGSYGDGKAIVHSRNLRFVVSNLRGTKSLLIIVSQTRDNIGLGFQPKTRSGGRALEFYSAHVIWLAKLEKIKKTVRGKPRTIGTWVRSKVTKNSITGRQLEVDFPVYYTHGLDDVESMAKYLIEEKEIKKTGGTYTIGEEKVSSSKLDTFETEIRSLTESVWTDIKTQLQPEKKCKYE